MLKLNSVLVQEVQSKRVKSSVKLVQSIAKTTASNAAKKMANMKAVQALENAIESFPAVEDQTDAEKSAIAQLESEIEGRLKANIEIDLSFPEFAVLASHGSRIANGETWIQVFGQVGPVGPALPA
jgi:hypothetical protein